MPDSAPVYALDTSVVVKWFVERGEAEVQRARNLRAAHAEGRCRLVAPELLFLELANALLVGRRYSVDLTHEALGSMKDLGLETFPLRWQELEEAVRIAAAFAAPVYDAYFLATAVRSGCRLVTADDALLRRIGPHPNVVALRELRLETP